jgi:hypothetical protein
MAILSCAVCLAGMVVTMMTTRGNGQVRQISPSQDEYQCTDSKYMCTKCMTINVDLGCSAVSTVPIFRVEDESSMFLIYIGISPRMPGFAPGSINMGFVVDKVALGQVFLRVLRFFPVNIPFHRRSPNSYHLGNA